MENNCDHKFKDLSSPIQTIAWNKFTGLKCEVGLYIRKWKDIDVTFITKLGWKILAQPNNIWVRLVRP